MSEVIRIEDEFFKLVEGTYEMNVCDRCGCRRKCDWWENVTFTGIWTTGYDFCRECSEELREDIE